MWLRTNLVIKLVFFLSVYVAIVAIALLHLFHPNWSSRSQLTFHNWLVLFSALIIVPFWVVSKAVRRLRGRNDVVLKDGGHVLYLRPFTVDASLINEVIRFMNQTITLGPLRSDMTLELGLAAATRSVGEFVAIGCPSDIVSPDGATRIYVGNDSWQQKVIGLIRSAGAIILVSGTSEGVAWEKERIREHVDPRRLLLIIPPAGHQDRQRMVDLSSRYLHTTIRLPSSNREDDGPLFYIFEPNWKVLRLPRRDKKGGTRILGFEVFPTVIDFGHTLAPFLDGLPASSLTRRRPTDGKKDKPS